MTEPKLDDNPLLQPEWETPFGLPPFDRIKTEHFRPAFEEALRRAKAEIEAIATDKAAPSFDNTLLALERSGGALKRVAMVFFNLVGTDATPELQKIQAEIAPKLARFNSETMLDARLFERVEAVFEQRDALPLSAEQRRVLEETRRDFHRAGAGLDAEARARMTEIKARRAELGAQIMQNLLADEADFALRLETQDDLAGLPDFLKDAAEAAARERGWKDGYAITLSRALVEPFLMYSARRDLREQAYRAWIGRGEKGGESDNRAIATETLALRAEQARLLGHDTYAQMKLETEMAKTPDAASDLLRKVWAPALRRAEEEAASLQDLIDAEGGGFELAGWDWRYYAEIHRRKEHDLDEAALKPYLSLENVQAAAFDVASRLFGLIFQRVEDAPRHHADVTIWEVAREQDGETRHVGLFVSDPFARASKRSGAWMSALRDQHKLDGEQRPIIINVMNFAKAPAGRPTLLTFDDARTLFHEFGHALHGLMSDVTFPSLSGTNVARDFVELPSQLYEHWFGVPEILAKHARHIETGEPMPAELIAKVKSAENAGQGFATVEYLASALVDMALHQAGDAADPMAIERETLAEIGMPNAIAMRHRTPQFAHLFSGDGYAAGYYSYMWAEVMDADAFEAFEATGDAFDKATADRLAEEILTKGGLPEPEAAYLAFRGAPPSVDALLRGRGLA